MDLLGLADNQTQVRAEFLDRTITADFVPAVGRDCRRNQLDQ